MPVIPPPSDMSFVAILPALVVIVAALAVLVADAFIPEDRQSLAGWLALAGVLVTLAVCVALAFVGGSTVAFSGGVTLDGFALFFDVVSLIGAALAVLISINYLDREEINHGEYYVLLLFAVSGMMLLASSSDLIVFFLGFETLSIALYVLAGFNRTRLASEEAGMKYFLLGAFSFGFMLYGIALVYGATGATSYSGIAAMLQQQPAIAAGALMGLGVALIITGFGFKLAFVPFHLWTPDVYEGAPTPITAFMSVGTKAAVFAALVRLLSSALPSMAGDWVPILAALAIVTMVVGNVIALVQDNIKRMLAYSSIAQAGYVVVAVVAGQAGAPSVMFYMLAYTIMNIGAFAVVIALGQRGETSLDIRDYTGMGYRQPFLAAAMAIFLLSLAGIPPTAGFFGKFYLFAATLAAGHPELAIVGVLGTAISIYYYLRVIVIMYLRQPEAAPARPTTALAIPGALSLSLVVTAVVTVLLGVIPGSFVALAQSAIAAPLH